MASGEHGSNSSAKRSQQPGSVGRAARSSGRRTHKLRALFLTATAIGLTIVLSTFAFAADIDMTTVGATATINDAIFETFNPVDPTGSGTFASFVRISTNNSVEKGYNTSARPVQFDENNSPTFTKDFSLSGVPIVVKDGVLYREFQLDINQNNTGNAKFLTLDDVELYLDDGAGSLSQYPFNVAPGPTAEQIYKMDSGADNTLKLDYALNAGSGKRDLRLLVPEENFEAAITPNCKYGASTCGTNVTLFSQFGGDDFDGSTFGNNDGFEEWGVAIYSATKSGVKFKDLNANGVREAGEPGLEGWTIFVDIDGDGVLDPSELSDVTDATGAYSIGPIPPGTFDVREDCQAKQPGWRQTLPAPASNSEADCGTGFYTVTFGTSGDHPGNDFGNFQKQPSQTDTLADPTGGDVAPGTTVHDTATVTGVAGGPDPSGDVAFFICDPSEVTAGGCEGTAGTKVGADKPLDGGAVTTDHTSTATSDGFDLPDDATAIGTWCWRAEYEGDTFYNASSFTNATDECFTVVKQPSQTDTLADPTGGDVAPGTTVHDTATVTGVANGPDPSGDVAFFICDPSEVTAGGCEGTAGTKVGADKPLDGGAVTTDHTSTATSDGFDLPDDATAIGTWCWRAEYEGDTFYNASSFTNATDECFTVVKQPSQTDTLADPTGGDVAPGTTVHDTATVTGVAGGPDPSGDVAFFICDPSEVTAGGCEGTAGTKVGADKPLDGGAVTTDHTSTATSDGFDLPDDATAIGTWCWRAEYEGDTFYNASSFTNATDECFTVVKQPSQTDTLADPTGGDVAPGTTVHDTATVTGVAGGPDPSGDVAFFICDPSEVTAGGCEGTAGTKVGADKPLDGGAVTTDHTSTATSDGFDLPDDATAIGTWCWRAEYEGDTFYNASSFTNATDECFTVVKQPSQTDTLADPTGGDVAPGTTVHDTATVTGVAGGPDPSGDVAFFICDPSEVTAGGCEGTAGTKVGADKPLDGGAVTTDHTSTATSDGFDLPDDATAIGTWCWRAEYEGDTFYNASSFTNATDECFTVVKQPSQTDTLADPTGGDVAPGTTVHDTATVTGVANGPDPSGDVAFFICDPSEVTAGGCEGTAGTKVGADKPLDGGAVTTDHTSTATSDGFDLPDDATAIGTWCWRAEYEGDTFYNASSFTNATDECFTVVKQPSQTTTQSSTVAADVTPGTLVHDTATVAGAAGQPDPTGTVQFFICDPATVTANGGNCSTGGTQVGTPPEGETLDLGTLGDAISTATSEDFTVPSDPSAIGTWCWSAVYSGDGFYNGSSELTSTNECFTVVNPRVFGKTPGFWQNQNGHAMLLAFYDQNHDGTFDAPIVIGLPGGRTATVTDITSSDKILRGKACMSPTSFNIACSSRSNGLQSNTLDNLARQTLALRYNTDVLSGFASQTLGQIGCVVPTALLDANLPVGLKPGLSSSSTLTDVLALANRLIGYSTVTAPFNLTTQTQAGAMNGLLGCVNAEA